MPGYVHEWHGFSVHDRSALAARVASEARCPFLGEPCTKSGGVCSVQPSADSPLAVPVCPKRLYFDGYGVLARIAEVCFSGAEPAAGASGLPELVDGTDVVQRATAAGRATVGVFGAGWGGEIKLPPAHEGSGRYSIDYVLVLVTATGGLAGIVPVEVQTIDTTNSYRASVDALRAGRVRASSAFGMNWENVNKRILPQLIVKGLMLQGERLCVNGMFLITPEPVYQRILLRLGGERRFREIPRQPGSITFVRLDYRPDPPAPGEAWPLIQLASRTISTSDLSLAFVTPENLPPAGSYERLVRERL